MLDLPEMRVADGILASVGLDHFAGLVDGAPERQRLTHALKRKVDILKSLQLLESFEILFERENNCN